MKKILLLLIALLSGIAPALAAVTLEGEGVTVEGSYRGKQLYQILPGVTSVKIITAPDTCNQITVDNKRIVYKAQVYWDEYDFPVNRSEWTDGEPHRLAVLSGTILIGECYFSITEYEESTLLYDYEGDNAVLSGYAGAFGGSISIPSSVRHDGHDYTVRGIATEAFAGVRLMRRLTIPESIDSIGPSAFYGLERLDTLVYGARDCIDCGMPGSPAFPCATGALVIEEGVERIPPRGFFNLHYITKLRIPGSVRHIGTSAFTDCFSLRELVYGAVAAEDCGEFHEPAFPASVATLEIEDAVEEIPAFAFKGCAGLWEVSIPDGVRSVGRQAFSGCTGLLRVRIGSGLSRLPYGMLQQTSLRSLTMGGGVKEIDDQLCAASPLKSFWPLDFEPGGSQYLAGEINYVPEEAWTLRRRYVSMDIGEIFEVGGVCYLPLEDGRVMAVDCSYSPELREVELPKRVSIGDAEWEVGGVGYLALAGADSLRSALLRTEDVGEFALSGCTSLESVSVEGSVRLGRFLFNDCGSLRQVIIGNATEELGEHLFNGCASLDSVSIGTGCRCVGEDLFVRCGAMRRLYSLATVPPEAEDNSFRSLNMNRCTLAVQEGSQEAYREARGWKAFRVITTSGVNSISLERAEIELAAGVYDLLGRRLSEDARDLPPGIYIVSDGKRRKKILR